MIRSLKSVWWVASLGLLLSLSASAQSFEVPQLTGPVVDQARLLPRGLEERLTQALLALRQQTGTQLQILTVPDLGGETIEQASIRVTDQWKLGTAEQDNGVLLMVAVKEKRVRIEVGQGHEGTLTDAHSKRIIDEAIVPLFRSGHFDSGILIGAMQIAERLHPDFEFRAYFEGQNIRSASAAREPPSLAKRIFTFIIIGIMILVFLSNPGLFLLLLLGGGRRGGYRGGGGFGGGGWSGGGGGFSGGGASGGW